jgi:RNA polymerase sigma factor (TIGR02999 family)
VSTPSVDVTALLKAWGQGDTDALEHLTPAVYAQMRRLAGGYLRRERAGHLLQTTGLVHEAYLRLATGNQVMWRDREHFYAVTARIMRHILVDYARQCVALKRGGGQVPADGSAIDLDDLPAASTERAATLCALDDALAAFAQLDARRAQVVELRFFGGLSVEETAEALNVSAHTVIRDWNVAKAWLARELSKLHR